MELMDRVDFGKGDIPPWTSFIILVAHLLRNAFSNGKAPAVMTVFWSVCNKTVTDNSRRETYNR